MNLLSFYLNYLTISLFIRPLVHYLCISINFLNWLFTLYFKYSTNRLQKSIYKPQFSYRLYTYISFKLIALLLVSGVSSAVERLLLASIQARQAPNSSTLFGFITLVLDGIKLFSKLTLDTYARTTFSVVVIATVFFAVVPLDSILNPLLGTKYFDVSRIIFLFAVLSILEVFEFTVLTFTSNHFVSISILRFLVTMIISELTFGFILLWIVLQELTTYDSIVFWDTKWINVLTIASGLWVILLTHTGTNPFDVVEAESELIDGITTDIGAVLFSVVYAAEVVTALITLKILLLWWHTALNSILFSMFIVIAFFWGKMFMARFLFQDLLELVISTLLILPVFYVLLV